MILFSGNELNVRIKITKYKKDLNNSKYKYFLNFFKREAKIENLCDFWSGKLQGEYNKELFLVQFH